MSEEERKPCLYEKGEIENVVSESFDEKMPCIDERTVLPDENVENHICVDENGIDNVVAENVLAKEEVTQCTDELSEPIDTSVNNIDSVKSDEVIEIGEEYNGDNNNEKVSFKTDFKLSTLHNYLSVLV